MISAYFKYPETVRRLIYTTNAIEGFNRQLRKVTKSKMVFPTDDSLLKMLYLAMMDIFKDISKLESSYKDNSEAGSSFAIEDLEIFENVAYIIAYHADHNIPEDIDDWLDQFEMFSIYEVLPEILELWGTNLITDVESKKNLNAVIAK